MKKIIILMGLMTISLLACQARSTTVNFVVLESEIDSILNVDVNIGEEIRLPDIKDEWFELDGWYLDSDYKTKVTTLLAENEDITLYGLYQPALSIGIIGDPDYGDFDLVEESVNDYARVNNRVYKSYALNYDDYNTIKPLTMDAIHEAVNDGANIIFLTSTWRQSEAVYEAQDLYPNIKFVLLGYQPRENYFYSEPYITKNTLSTKAPFEASSFLAGYMVVMEGYRHLGYFGANGLMSISSGIGFIAGAYYAADRLGVNIDMSDETYKIVDNPTRLISHRFAQGLFESGTELIYTCQQANNTIIEDYANEVGKDVILGINSITNQSESILTSINMRTDETVLLILDKYFNHQFIGGMAMPELFGLSMDSSRFENLTNSQYQEIMDDLQENIIDLPTDYDSLMAFLDGLNNIDEVYFSREIIEGVQAF